MRPLAAIIPLLLIAGCTNTTDTPSDSTTTTPPTTDPMGYPAPINETKAIQGSADPLANLAAPPCQSPTSQCYKYPFELNSTAKIAANLTWGTQANDFDLYVFLDGQPTEFGSASQPPGTKETLEENLDPGKYELVVAAYAVTQDTYKLEATFGPAS